jgi:ABC-type tungstate transport system permease subunit
MKRGLAWILTLVFAVLTVPEATKATERFLKMSTTTSTENSGGQGMGKTLTYAEEKSAYTLAERGTY